MKFRYLDGLRGLAALVVVIDHLAISFFQRATDASVGLQHTPVETAVMATPLHLLVSGNFSVCIFFVLSGFVLSAKFFRTGDRSVVAASAFRRYARLELPILASVLLVYGLLLLDLFHNGPAAALTGSTWLADLWGFTPTLHQTLYHATIGLFIHGTSTYNTVLWTMQMELLGSFLVFGLLLAAGRWQHRHWLYGTLALLCFNSYLICFIAGVALCDWYMRRSRPLSLRARWWVPLLVASLLLGSVPVGQLAGTWYGFLPGWLDSGLGLTARTHITGAMLLVFTLVNTPLLQRPLEHRAVTYVGRTSFALYLTHLLVIGTFSSWLFTTLWPALGYLPAFGLMVVPSAVLIWLTADLFTRWIDEPAIRLSGWLYTHFFPRRWKIPAAAPAVEPAAPSAS